MSVQRHEKEQQWSRKRKRGDPKEYRATVEQSLSYFIIVYTLYVNKIIYYTYKISKAKEKYC